jgi:hypothetical protein
LSNQTKNDTAAIHQTSQSPKTKPPRRQVPCTCTQKSSIFTHLTPQGARHRDGSKQRPGALFPNRSTHPKILPGWRQGRHQVPCTCLQKASVFTHFNYQGARHCDGSKHRPGALFPNRSTHPKIRPGWRQAECSDAHGQGTPVIEPRNRLH